MISSRDLSQILEPLLVHLLLAVKATVFQLFSILFVFLVLGMLLHFQERAIFRVLLRTFSPRAVIYSTGWLGVPIHELSHLLMALLFGHKIGKVSFFDLDEQSGTLGYVQHFYNKANPYHLIGNFFIGIAPLLGGSFVMFLAYYFLLRDSLIINLGSSYYRDLSQLSLLISLKKLLLIVLWIVQRLFNPDNFTTWKFWLFLYLAFCIGAHIAPSRSDLGHAGYGLSVIVAVLLLLNFVFSFRGGVPGPVIYSVKAFISPLAAIMILSVVLNNVNLLLSVFISLTIGWLRGGSK